MGSMTRKCLWYKRRRGEYVAIPYDWKPEYGDLVFTTKEQLKDFADAGGMILKERQTGGQSWTRMRL